MLTFQTSESLNPQMCGWGLWRKIKTKREAR